VSSFVTSVGIGGRLSVIYFFTSRWCIEGASGCREEYWRQAREATRLSSAGWRARGVVGAGAGRRRAIGEGERHVRSARVGGARDGRL